MQIHKIFPWIATVALGLFYIYGNLCFRAFYLYDPTSIENLFLASEMKKTKKRNKVRFKHTVCFFRVATRFRTCICQVFQNKFSYYFGWYSISG